MAKLEELKGEVPDETIEILKKKGIAELYEPQEKAYDLGILSSAESVVISSPTASGKTLIAEMIMGRTLFDSKGICVYLCPMEALLNEKYGSFKIYREYSIDVTYKYGNVALGTPTILLTIPESFLKMLSGKPEWLAFVNCLVVDEIHLIDDSMRGPSLEAIVSLFRTLNPEAQIVGLSATIKNHDELAAWLGAKSVYSEFRPTKLVKDVASSDGNRSKRALELAMDTISDKNQVLLFKRNKSEAESLALSLSKAMGGFFTYDARKDQIEEAKKLLPSDLDKVTSTDRKIQECVESGIAFHHAGLRSEQKKRIIELYKKGIIHGICSTPTLAFGVNLPAKRVIIVEPQLGQRRLTVNQYVQMGGRAGRPDYGIDGEIILISKNEDQRAEYLERYVNGELEPIESKFNPARDLIFKKHILDIISSDLLNEERELIEFVKNTLFGFINERNKEQVPRSLRGKPVILKRMNILDIEKEVVDVIEWLDNNGFLEIEDSTYRASEFGKVTVQHNIHPSSADFLRQELRGVLKESDIFYFLNLLSKISPDIGYVIPIRFKRETKEKISKFYENYGASMDIKEVQAEHLTAVTLSFWIEGESQGKLEEELYIYGGSIKFASTSFIRIIKMILKNPNAFNLEGIDISNLETLHERLRYGVKDELVPFVTIPGVGRTIGTSIFTKYKTLENLKDAELNALADMQRNVEAQESTRIGKRLANKILAHVRGEEIEDETIEEPQEISDLIKVEVEQEGIEPHEMINEVRTHIADIDIFKNHRTQVESGLTAYEETNYTACLSTLVNTFEGIVRSIYTGVNIGGTEKTFRPMINELLAKKWISNETYGFLLTSGRNLIDHGFEGEHKQFPEMYSNLCILGLLKLARDFIYFNTLRKCFSYITSEPSFNFTGKTVDDLISMCKDPKKCHIEKRFEKDCIVLQITLNGKKFFEFENYPPAWDLIELKKTN